MPYRRNNIQLAHAAAPVAGVVEDLNAVRCCSPSGCVSETGLFINLDDLYDVVKVICNYESCNQGQFMHRICFDAWEASVLTFLRSCGRARSWSEKQRLQNLWTKKGYDLAYKACGCLCGRGHLRKDLDFVSPHPEADLEARRKRKNSNRNHNNNNCANNGMKATPIPVASRSGHVGNSTNAGIRNRANSLSSNGSGSGSCGSGSGSPPDPVTGSMGQVSILRRKPSKQDSLVNRERHGSEGSCLFAHRVDFSSFNALPRHKLNSYHIKMEDQGSYGNDDIRCFILSNLATARMSRVCCVLCQSAMVIFDRYPIIDGTFFLSPKQYSNSCVPVTVEGRQQFLSSVCMGCLEGWTCSLECRSCRRPWDGSSLILGTMYSYDIFAAVPCCVNRLRCNHCAKLVVAPEHRFPYFSHYSRDLRCPHCSSNQPHFVKPLPGVFQLVPSPRHTPDP